MGKAILIEKGGDLVGLARDLLLSGGAGGSGGEDLAKCLVVFPGRRPGHFLTRALAEALRKPFIPPQIFSMDDWVEETCRTSGENRPLVSEIDAVALLFRLVKESGLPGLPGGAIALDAFMPWGYKLFSDFEELTLEGVTPKSLRRYEVLIGIGTGGQYPGMERVLSDLSRLYERFYLNLGEEGLFTRSLAYRRVAEAGPDLAGFQKTLLVGFFALSGAEETIFKKVLTSEKALLLLQDGDGSGIEDLIKRLGASFERLEGKPSQPKIHYWKAPDVHGEVVKLSQVLENQAGIRTAVVLPSAGTLFPVLQVTLSGLDVEWNVSMGYPLHRTPVWSLLATLGRALESSEERDRGDRETLYFVPDYLRLLLHPYVKNLFWGQASSPTRILLHTVEETLSGRQARFARLEDIEGDGEILKEALQRLFGSGVEKLSPRAVTEHLAGIHDILLRPFESLLNVGQFAGHLLALVSHLSLKSQAHQHPYSGNFFVCLIEALHELKSSRLAGETFGDARGYFELLESHIQGRRVPFPGTPLRGLQVLGSLETRNLKFDHVYLLDANEGILPATGEEDTLLPHAVRQQLGLSTHEHREAIARYYFENLLAGAKEVHLFYVESGDREKSRFVERLLWEEQKRAGSLDVPEQGVVFFQSTFSKKDPEPIPKNPEILAKLKGMAFSPSNLDVYLACPLKFYYQKVLGLEEKGELGEDLEAPEIGTYLHNVLKEVFQGRTNRPLRFTKTDYEKAARIAERIFQETFGGHREGRLYLIHSQVQTRLREILLYHAEKLAGTVIQACEQDLTGSLEVPGQGRVAIRGRLDRIDLRGKETVILDYKSGSTAKKPTARFSPGERENWHKTLGSVQLPLYLLLYKASNPETKIEHLNSGLMLLKTRPIEEKFLFRDKDDREELFKGYCEAVTGLIREILDPGMPFGDTPDPAQTCPNCSYRVMCGRQWAVKNW
jgi:CRISPR/Cas system-associated exonuclease Cas4 (RecB family)